MRDYAQAALGQDPGNSDSLAYLDSAQLVRHFFNLSATVTSTIGATFTRADQPVSIANGCYEVKRFLDEGGKKKVYLPQDALPDREVASSFIKTEGLDEVFRVPINREAQVSGFRLEQALLTTVANQSPLLCGKQGRCCSRTPISWGGTNTQLPVLMSSCNKRVG